MRRRTANRHGLAYESPLLAFLAIMLGVMSVMALNAIALTVEKRQETKRVTAVQLVGIPNEFRPLHLRCTPDEIYWLDDRQQWRSTSALAFASLLRGGPGGAALGRNGLDLLRFLKSKEVGNRALSYLGQQHTLILWIEPEGETTAGLLQYVMGEMNLALRTGKLPIAPGEEIRPDEALPR
jgi:hypothetical protein